MRAIETAIREKWRVLQAWRARFREQQRQRARYSLIAVQYPKAVANWLLGLSGAGMLLAFGFYLQSYLSILSIKNDCVSLHFVAHAMTQAVAYAYEFMFSGIFALVAIVLPTAVGIGRNLLRWYKAQKLPPLKPGHEFDGWSDFQVTGRVTILQWVLVGFSLVLFFGMPYILMSAGNGMKPEGVRAEWHKFELQCVTQPPVGS